MAEVLDVLVQRRARRAFDARPVENDVQETLWRALQVAPSHMNAQPTRVLVARSADVREKLLAALSAGNQSWAPAAPLLFALVSLPEHDAVIEGSDGRVRELWGFHAGLAAGNLLAQATALGLIAHPIATFDEAAARAVFDAPAEARILVIFAVGYPGAVESLPEDLQRRESSRQHRLELDHLVGVDRWDAKMGVSYRSLREQTRK